jgi:hypothetical protein
VKKTMIVKSRKKSADKLENTKIMLGSKQLASFVPEAQLMTHDSLQNMLNKYGMVYIKPRRGSQGRGVMRVEMLGSDHKSADKGKYRYQSVEKSFQFSSFDMAYNSLSEAIKGESYVVQQGIHLLNYKGRPFDIRLVVQKNLQSGSWDVTGAVVRVASPRKIVTNGSQGGTIYPLEHILKGHTSSDTRRRLIRTLNTLGVAATMKLQQSYPDIKQIGMDFALDRKLKPWILEANTKPGPCPFTKLKDKSMLRTILRYAKTYGLTYSLHCKKAKQGL